MAIVNTVLLVLVLSNMSRRGLVVALLASMTLLFAACGSDAAEQAQVVAATSTPIPTTPPVAAPTSTPEPTATPIPAPTSTPLPTATVAPTALPAPTPEPAATATPAPAPAAAADDAPAPAADPTATAVPAPTSTPLPAATAEPAAEQPTADTQATPVPETPTAVVVASGEPPLECFDRDVQVYRGFVEGVDVLTFEGGRVYCSGAGTNAVSGAGNYRHSSGLVVQRNGDFILNAAGTEYIPYSGVMHFCLNGQPSSAQVVASTVPALLVVIDSEAQRQVAQGAVGPVTFGGGGSQC